MLLDVKNLSVHYDGMQALFGINLHVEQGEIISIIGSNGAGKSTFINAVSGLRKLSSGSVFFEDRSVTQVPAHERITMGIVQVPEGRRLFPIMTVEENLLLGSYAHKQTKKERKASFESVYDILPILRERRRQVAKTLSGGEQQMLAIGRALMSKPKLLMIDELSLGLAPFLIKELFALVKQISQQGITVLMVEQNVKQTLQIANRSYVFENGALSLEGKASELLNNEHVKKAFLGM
jgi:branched-chain amino acid transport system ATP-binding protein